MRRATARAEAPAASTAGGGGGAPPEPMTKKDCQNLILFVSALLFAAAFATSAAGIAVVRGHNVEPWGGYDDAENEDELVWCMQRKQNREGDRQSDQGWSLFIISFVFFWLSFFLLISRVCLVQLVGFAEEKCW